MQLSDMRLGQPDEHHTIDLSIKQLDTLADLRGRMNPDTGIMLVDLGRDQHSIHTTVEVILNEGAEGDGQQNWIMADDGELVEPTLEFLADRGLIEHA